MQLKKIKLAGFKSFVDPTLVLIPSKLVAVVGPNGCGKSNIIDAVCWVMGENSAKYLRGQSLADVIFNGSTARKPVGQASVELVFDNQDGALGGEYGSYSEISIRRSISREGDSNYFLNGTRCRRRDIIDIFLGTGLGPRSYSIIGQNMISRVIEAKPDEMRIYLEEAAGVSKYKERRRETENRIHHTKENLARLNDIRAELEKQLNSLKRQANAAEKYKLLKQEERGLKAQWLVAQWRQLDQRLLQSTLQIQQQETGLEAKQAELTAINLQLETQRDEQRSLNETYQEIQRQFYSAGNEITRIEQEIRHHQERQQQWELDIQQINQDWTINNTNLEEAEHEIEELIQDTLHITPELEQAIQAVQTHSAEAKRAEETLQHCQNQWDDFNQQLAKTTQIAQVEQTRIQHLEQRIQTIKQRHTKLTHEQAQINFNLLDDEIKNLADEASTVTVLNEKQQQQLQDLRAEILAKQEDIQQNTLQLDAIRNQLQQLRGQQASLEALQQTALGQRNNTVIHWLAQHKLDRYPRLAQTLEVAAGWEKAVETALGFHLQAVCVDELTSISALIDEFKEGNLSIFAKGKESRDPISPNSLISKIQSPWSLTSLLAGIYVAENHAEAFKLCESLAPHESVITRDGIWMSASWIRMARDEHPEAGVFQREQELKQFSKQIQEKTSQQEELSEKIANTQLSLKQLEQLRDDCQNKVNLSRTEVAKIQTQQKMQTKRLDELKTQANRYRQEQDEITVQLQQAEEELSQAKTKWQRALAELENSTTKKEQLNAERDQVRAKVQSTREQLNQAKEEKHQQEIRLQTTQSQQALLEQNISRLKNQLNTLNERKKQIEHELASASSADNLAELLANALKQRLQIEGELNSVREKIALLEHDLRIQNNQRQEIENESAKFRDLLETLRVEWQGFKVRSETLIEQIKETGLQLEEVLKQLPEEIDVDTCHAQLEQITQRISRLGAINLVAIEEYTTCSERKEYLDKQCSDLQEGLTTLENAIGKIDKETRSRFKETFEKVNQRFQELFPMIFGGGRAYMELTGENLLDAGISVMACPPGKRNSTIHLLSGGEKAMTAIALVFSIFHLNPAPFCLLDEVDAPLDDANISRFCQLVKNMSEKTQFIFISHNKLAIEMAEHLMGVTMHEPGVSRLVSVNVEEAVSLAGA